MDLRFQDLRFQIGWDGGTNRRYSETKTEFAKRTHSSITGPRLETKRHKMNGSPMWILPNEADARVGRSADTFVRENWRKRPMGQNITFVNKLGGGLNLVMAGGYQRKAPSRDTRTKVSALQCQTNPFRPWPPSRRRGKPVGNCETNPLPEALHE
jgi:hypothetical protein